MPEPYLLPSDLPASSDGPAAAGRPPSAGTGTAAPAQPPAPPRAHRFGRDPSPAPAAPAPREPEAPAAAVFIGRFQPFHSGHLGLLRQALAAAPLAVVVLGSAWQARSPKNPFTWEERAEMIGLAVEEADGPAARARLRFLPVRDLFDESRWQAAVRRGVGALLAREGLGDAPPVALVGHFKDATSEYLRGFPGWRLLSLPRSGPTDATAVRDAYFGCAAEKPAHGEAPLDRARLDACLVALTQQLPPAIRDVLRAWAALPPYRALAEEWHMLQRYRAAWAAAPYPPVFVTVDAVVRCGARVLLVRRGGAPGRGQWAVPGGFVEPRETLWQSALRELAEETGLALPEEEMRARLRAVAVFDHPDRSQRGRTITHAHFFDLGERPLPAVRAGDDAAAAEWMPVERLAALEPECFEDHFHMLDHFLRIVQD
ncbi:MAG: NUDIX domain-containing protein [Xylophilus ampelinus]